MCGDITFDMRTALQLDLVGRGDVADDLATDDSVLDVDLGLDDARLPDNECLGTIDDTVELGVDAQGPFDVDVRRFCQEEWFPILFSN